MNWLKWSRKRDPETVMRQVPRSDTEKRSSARVPLQQAVTVRFTSGGHYEFNGVSRDISESGIFVLVESDLIEVGSHVEIMLNLPSKNGPMPMRVQGRVVRVEKPLPSGIAIAFDRLVVEPSATNNNECGTTGLAANTPVEQLVQRL